MPQRIQLMLTIPVGRTLCQMQRDNMIIEALQPSIAAVQVRRVGLRIAQKAEDGAGGGYWQHMKSLEWEYAVIKCDWNGTSSIDCG